VGVECGGEVEDETSGIEDGEFLGLCGGSLGVRVAELAAFGVSVY
jgi:hypothetical protein